MFTRNVNFINSNLILEENWSESSVPNEYLDILFFNDQIFLIPDEKREFHELMFPSTLDYWANRKLDKYLYDSLGKGDGFYLNRFLVKIDELKRKYGIIEPASIF